MAECNISRCSHERRMFRRELHKWSKEILYILGLERLAEELMGTWKWKILVKPFTDLESNSPVDWYPEETCYFCCAKKQPPYDPASGIIPTIDSYNSLRLETDEHSTSSDQVKLSGSFISCSSAVSPWSVPALSSNVSSSSPPLDQPLDLSVGTLKQPVFEGSTCSTNEKKHSNHIGNNSNDKSCLKSVLKVPQIPIKHGLRKRVDANSKRSYTEEELQAALRDIQSGKLGTRRAAVIYGIPRSTLRNKVYKLANESKSRTHCRVNQSTGNSTKTETTKDNKESADLDVPVLDNLHKQNITSASNSLRQLLKHTITQKAQTASKSSDKIKNSFPLLSNIDTMAELQMLGNLECSQSLGPVLSHVFSDIQNLALVKSKENLNSASQSLNALKDEMKLPLLPDLIRRLAEERIELEKDIHKNDDETEQTESADMSSSYSQSNVILKVPSFRPVKSSSNNFDVENPCLPASSSPPPQTSSHSLSGNKGIAVSLKELIARSISQKVNNHLKEEDQNLDYPFGSSTADGQGISSSWVADHAQRDEKESLNNTNNSSNSSDSIKSEKRTRPKRGRYRNYDRDNLARAVRAVQKGEMSVHRAGTFYGVPHSTLEYKVKERHLLRPKKRDAFNSTLLSDSSEPISVNKSNNFSIENNISLKNLKNNLNQMSFETSAEAELIHRPAMDSYPSPLSIWQSLPFLSLDFAQLGSNNFFASQMMRKLQENARVHEETLMKQRKEDIGILETLIKSTLEKSVTPDNKSPFILSTDSTPNLCDSNKTENIDGK